jgi:hypothetical protein
VANTRLHTRSSLDFANTGKMAPIAFAVAATLLVVVLLLAFAYLSYRTSSDSGKPDGTESPLPVKR